MIETLKTISLPGVRTVLERVFLLVGTPDTLDCDDVSPLQGRAIQQYLESMRVWTLRRPPTRDQQDRERGSFMRQLCRALSKGARDIGDAEWFMHLLLGQFRASPHEATDVVPRGCWAYINGCAFAMSPPSKKVHHIIEKGRRRVHGQCDQAL